MTTIEPNPHVALNNARAERPALFAADADVTRTVRRLNAEINTAASWERRWQIEREHNELLNKQASMVRTGVHGLLALAKSARLRSETWRSGYAAALRDVMELMEGAEG
jgi:succinate dehydrogenase/fumarate reductase flavoprotein subunit